MILLQTKDLSFTKGLFKKKPVLKNINITLKKGDILAIYGRTASGKTALLNIISGLTSPTSGTIEKKGVFSYAIQEFVLYEDLTVEENVDFACEANNFSHKDKSAFLGKTGLKGWENVRAKQLPEGLRKMLQIACAFSKDFDFILLDEPTLGVDYVLSKTVWSMINETAAAGKGVLLTASTEDDISHCKNIYRLD